MSVGNKLGICAEEGVNDRRDVFPPFTFRVSKGTGRGIDRLRAVPVTKSKHSEYSKSCWKAVCTHPGKSGTSKGHWGGISFTNSLYLSAFWGYPCSKTRTGSLESPFLTYAKTRAPEGVSVYVVSNPSNVITFWSRRGRERILRVESYSYVRCLSPCARNSTDSDGRVI